MDLKDPKPFKFKQFEVHHHLSTFKVNTDGVLLGCLADLHDCKTALDIGTGTGMISLILAQRSPKLTITGIEIHPASAQQAAFNAEVSPFSHRIKIINADCFDYHYPQQYDVIVCNPPYFVGGTLPNKSKLSQAKHSDENFLKRLITKAADLLSMEGTFKFLYPYSQDSKTEALITQSSLNLVKKTLLKSYTDSEPYACVYAVQRETTKKVEESFVLYKTKRVFTEEHLDLTREFYSWVND